MVRKRNGIDVIVGGWLISIFVMPQFKDALMQSFFCNSFIEDGTENAFELFGGSCTYGFIILYIIPGIYAVVRVIPYVVKFINWIDERH